MIRQLTVLALAALVTAAFNARAADAPRKENPKVAELAREGHWLEQGWAKHSALLNKPAPKLELSDWFNGKVTPEQMKGKIVVVDYWATWCGPCKASIPHNNEVARKYADKGVLVVGACGSNRGQDQMEEVARSHNMEYPTAKVSAASTKAWAVMWWPTYAIIDRDGNIRALGIKPDYVDKIVDALLEEQPAK